MPFKESPHQVAVIDIGSNSVRLVIYDGYKRAPNPLFNEKMLCGLARGMNNTSTLNPEGVISAHNTITRFIKLTRIMGIKKLHILATSAVRDASDGKKFVKKIESLHKVKVTVALRGREMEHKNLAFDLINRFVQDCSLWGTPEKNPKMEGKMALVILNPLPHSHKKT